MATELGPGLGVSFGVPSGTPYTPAWLQQVLPTLPGPPASATLVPPQGHFLWPPPSFPRDHGTCSLDLWEVSVTCLSAPMVREQVARNDRKVILKQDGGGPWAGGISQGGRGQGVEGSRGRTTRLLAMSEAPLMCSWWGVAPGARLGWQLLELLVVSGCVHGVGRALGLGCEPGGCSGVGNCPGSPQARSAPCRPLTGWVRSRPSRRCGRARPAGSPL